MPELPEVETIRLALLPHLLGASISAAALLRRDILIAPGDPRGGFSRQRTSRAPTPTPLRTHDLLQRCTITDLTRRGKQLAIIARAPNNSEHILIVQLGMSGQLLLLPRAAPLPPHTHAHWSLPTLRSRLVFRDPRRFGGLTVLHSRNDLDLHWTALGPDALSLTVAQLHTALRDSARPIKATLLDQSLIAGVGNIYADEALFRAGIRPDRRGGTLARNRTADLAPALRKLLKEAIFCRGTTLRDYRDPDGHEGGFQARHAVYGRAGLPCPRCSQTLSSALLAQRTTVWCPSCQT